MSLKFKRDTIFMKVETTGLSPAKDKIVKICLIKHFIDKSKKSFEKSRLIDPLIPIPFEATNIHGITDESVKGQPSFKTVSKSLFDFFENSDIIGFNILKFDLPILVEEFLRCGIDFDIKNRNIIDLYSIYYKMEPRDIIGTHNFYTNKNIEYKDDLSTVRGMIDIFKAQIEKYKDKNFEDKKTLEVIEKPISSPESISEFIRDKKTIDLAGFFKYDDNNIPVFCNGKHINKSVFDVMSTDISYYNWFMSNANYPTQTKNTVKDILNNNG